MTDVPS